jgi:hypothetical protein
MKTATVTTPKRNPIQILCGIDEELNGGFDVVIPNELRDLS